MSSTTRRPTLFLVSLPFLLVAACGGGAPSGPTSLAYHYDEVHIAQFSLDEKSAVLAAQNDYQRARAEQMKAESELSESATNIQVAKNELKQALLAEQSAEDKQKAANASADMNRSNAAAKELRIAQLERRAADEKVTYLKAHRQYLERLVRFREEETYHQEARYEAEKAKLGKDKSIAPRGVNYSTFPEQVQERSRRSQVARQKLEGVKQKAEEAEKRWKARLSEVEQAKGGASASTSNSES